MSVQSESDMSDTDNSSSEEYDVIPPGFVFERNRVFALVPYPPDPDEWDDDDSVDRFHEDEALSGLQKFCDDPDEHCDTFSIHGFLCRDPYALIQPALAYERLTLSDRVAAAILQALEKFRAQWKILRICNTDINGPLLQVLEAARSLNTIYSFTIETCGDPVSETFPVLSCFVAGNPMLTKLFLIDVTLDLPCLELIKTVLITTPVSTSEGDVMEHQSRKPQLTSLVINEGDDTKLEDDDFKVLSAGFRCNQTLINLALLNAYLAHHSFPLESLIGHPTLETLRLSMSSISDDALLSLVKVLHHPSCRIQSLYLDDMLETEDSESPRVDFFANALANGISSSLISLSLEKNRVSCDEFQNLMMAIYRSCPNLEELDLTDNCVKRIIWNHSDAVPSVLCANEPLSSLAGGVNDSSGMSSTISSHKACALQRLFLGGNGVVENNYGEERSSMDNDNFEALLRDFPALGQITQNKFAIRPRFLRFSPKVHTLFSFNRLTRGRLNEGQLPASLWYKILARIPLALDCEEKEMDRWAQENDLHLDRRIRHARICQASVLFVLLNRHPSQVTIEACRVVEDEMRCSLLLPLESIDNQSTNDQDETVPTKRPKLE